MCRAGTTLCIDGEGIAVGLIALRMDGGGIDELVYRIDRFRTLNSHGKGGGRVFHSDEVEIWSYEGNGEKVHQSEWMLFGLASQGLAFGFTTLNRWWKAGGGIAMRLCGGNVVSGYITQNWYWRDVGTLYTALNALWNEWTSGIQQLKCYGLGADGYRWPNNCSSDWLDFASRSASQL
ncbi:hypothetical protein T01_16169 [Trichinella spiralis]|uniref:Uncharacterized protein n=1 Tax=Trichinella spiralis TaxID=6334 RepID=A0A0V1B2Z5_TRISP|nr:hypothetical protein T01_16169 [Trichinella spiralis]